MDIKEASLTELGEWDDDLTADWKKAVEKVKEHERKADEWREEVIRLSGAMAEVETEIENRIEDGERF